MSQNPSPKQKELERLQDLFRTDQHSAPLECELTDFQLFKASIQKCTTDIPEWRLSSLWFHHKLFPIQWKGKRAKRELQEENILMSLIVKGITAPDALYVIQAWWNWHKLRYDDSSLQFLHIMTYPKALKRAQEYLDAVAAKDEAKRQQRLAGRSRAKIMKILEAGPLRAKEISDTLAKDPAASGVPFTKKDYDANRRQLTRMVNEQCIRTLGRGVYAALLDGALSPTPDVAAHPDPEQPVRVPPVPTPPPEDESDEDLFTHLALDDSGDHRNFSYYEYERETTAPEEPEAIKPLTRDDRALIAAVNNTSRFTMTEEFYRSFKDSPQFPAWAAQKREAFPDLFEPEDNGICRSKAKLPF